MDEAKAPADKAHGTAKGLNMSDEEGPALVSRPVQAGIGLFTAVIVYSAAFGGLFGLAFAFAYGRVPGALRHKACRRCWRQPALSPSISCRTSNIRQARRRWESPKRSACAPRSISS